LRQAEERFAIARPGALNCFRLRAEFEPPLPALQLPDPGSVEDQRFPGRTLQSRKISKKGAAADTRIIHLFETAWDQSSNGHADVQRAKCNRFARSRMRQASKKAAKIEGLGSQAVQKGKRSVSKQNKFLAKSYHGMC